MYSLSKNIFLRDSSRKLICIQTLVTFSTTVTQDQPPHNSLMVDYLINSFGFTRDRAISTSKLFPPTISLTNLNSVPDLLKQSGFSDTHIKNLISKQPKFLSCKDQTLKPKLTLFQKLGFSGSALADLILNNRSIIRRGIDKTLIPTIHFLQSMLHSDEKVVKTLKKCSWLFSFDLQKIISYNVEILRQCNVPDKQISKFLLRQPRFFIQRPDWLKNHISGAEKFGFKRGSGSFIYAVYTLSTMSKATLEAKFGVYKSYGWSESDIVSAFRKAPNFLMNSEQKVKAAMDFFVGELGYNPKEIALRPVLFGYSLEKRLKPRHEVLKMLKSRGLKLNCNLVSLADLSEKKFLEQYVLKYVKEVPDLQEAYSGSSTRS